MTAGGLEASPDPCLAIVSLNGGDLLGSAETLGYQQKSSK
jgi:hypothetical protein